MCIHPCIYIVRFPYLLLQDFLHTDIYILISSLWICCETIKLQTCRYHVIHLTEKKGEKQEKWEEEEMEDYEEQKRNIVLK